MTSSIGPIGAALYTALTGGTVLTSLLSGTLSVYQGQAIPGAVLPYVVYSLQGGGAINVNPSDVQTPVWFVRGYTQGGPAKAAAIDSEIEKLLNKKQIAIGGFSTLAIEREGDLTGVETPENQQAINMAGGFYRIWISD